MALISYLLGAGNGRNVKDFTIIEKDKLLIVARYGDTFVCKPYRGDKYTLDQRFELLTLEEMAARTMQCIILEQRPKIKGKNPSPAPKSSPAQGALASPSPDAPVSPTSTNSPSPPPTGKTSP